MGRYVPKTYSNRRVLRVIVSIFISVVLTAVILFVSLFFGLRKYADYGPDGTIRLEIPFLTEDPQSGD